MAETKTSNDFLLGGNGEQVAPMFHPVFTNKQQAYRFASWAIALAMTLPDDPEDDAFFQQVYDAIMGT